MVAFYVCFTDYHLQICIHFEFVLHIIITHLILTTQDTYSWCGMSFFKIKFLNLFFKIYSSLKFVTTILVQNQT